MHKKPVFPSRQALPVSRWYSSEYSVFTAILPRIGGICKQFLQSIQYFRGKIHAVYSQITGLSFTFARIYNFNLPSLRSAGCFFRIRCRLARAAAAASISSGSSADIVIFIMFSSFLLIWPLHLVGTTANQ